jgi:hypothetical protein
MTVLHNSKACYKGNIHEVQYFHAYQWILILDTIICCAPLGRFWNKFRCAQHRVDKVAMYIRVTFYYGNLIILWLFHLGMSCTMFVLICTVVVLYCFVILCVCVCARVRVRVCVCVCVCVRERDSLWSSANVKLVLLLLLYMYGRKIHNDTFNPLVTNVIYIWSTYSWCF